MSAVEDAGGAQAAVIRYLNAQFGKNKVQDVSFSKAWYRTGAQRDIWEVEGDVVLKRGLFSSETKHFKFQIDPEAGRVIAYEL